MIARRHWFWVSAFVACLVGSGPLTEARANHRWSDPPAGSSALEALDASPVEAVGASQTASTGQQQDIVGRSGPGEQPSQSSRSRELDSGSPALVQTSQGSRESADKSRPQAARELAMSYLDVWSAPNRVALAGTSRFYGSGAVFHGRTMSARALFEEKRRFVERWPVRQYRYRPGTMSVTCDPQGTLCTVRSVFDFTASNARLGRRSQGVGRHELLVGFQGDRPVITAENSGVLERRHSRR